MEARTVRSFAKLNLFLHVGEKRADGFHALETLFQEVDLGDVLQIEASSDFRLTCSDASIPVDSRNLVWRAYELLHARHSLPPVAIHIEKVIPSGGGLGGGSSNGAATLLALRAMFNLPISDSELLAMALQLGSDVPFFIRGGTAYARGRGEELIDVAVAAPKHVLLLLPEERVSTPEAYGALAAMRRDSGFPHGPVIGMERALELLGSDAAEWTTAFRNDLEAPAFASFPRLAHLKAQLYESGAAFALMSGSGSTLFGIFDTRAQLDAAARELEKEVRCVAASTRPRRTTPQESS